MEKESKQRPSSALSTMSTSSSSSSSPKSTSSCRPSLKCVEEQAEHQSKYGKVVNDYCEMIKELSPEVGNRTNKREKQISRGKCLELLSDPKSKDLKEVELLKLSDFLTGLVCFPFDRLTLSICEHIAEVMIIMHNKKRVSLNGCDEVVFTELAKSLAEVYRKAKHFKIFANAYDVVAEILNEKYEVGELQSYSFKKLCCISKSISVFNNHQPDELRKLTNLNIAKIIVEKHAKNQIDTDDGKAISRVVRGLNCCENYENILRDALLCLAKCLIAQYERDELNTYKILDLYHIICYFNFDVDDDKECSVKSLISVFVKALNSRISEGKKFGLTFKRLIHILVKLSMLIMKVDDQISVKNALKLLSEQLAPEIDSSEDKIKYLPFITKAFITLSMDDEKECLSSAMIATAKVIIQRHEDNLLQSIEVTEMVDYATAFRFWHNKDDVDIMKESMLSIANSLITKLKKGIRRDAPIMYFSNLVCSFGTFKDYDRKQSLITACDMIARKIDEYHKRVGVLQYNLKDFCLFVDGFSKWNTEIKSSIKNVLITMASEINMLQNEFPNIPPEDLATLANNFSKCRDIDNLFQLGLYKIAKSVFTIYESNKLRGFNAEQLMYLTSAFVKLHDRDDLQRTTRNGILCIAKRLTEIVSKLKGEYGSVLGYLHIFCNAFGIWCKDDDEQKSLELAITCIAEAVCVQYEQTNFIGFTIFELSVMCNSFRKYPENPSTFRAALAIANYVSEYDIADLLKNNSECLVFFVKAFSLLSENDNQLGSFKRAVHVIACAISTQLQNLDYALHCSTKNLVNLALYISRCPVDKVEFPYMETAIVSISLCFNNELGLNKLPGCSLEVLGKLTLAYSHWRVNTVIQRCIIFIAEQINKIDNTVIKDLEAKYLNYFLTGFSKFFANNYDVQSLKSLVLASCNVVIAHEVEDLKKYDEIFLLLLDQYFSKFSDTWDCHKAVITIRQLSKPFELVFGKTVWDIFVKVKGISDNEIKILFENDPLELSKLAVGCSTFLFIDDLCKTLKSALVAIAKCISDSLASDAVFTVSDTGKNENYAESNAARSNVRAKSSDSSLQRPIYAADVISNFVFAFCNPSPDEDFQPAMSVFAEYLTSCTADMLRKYDEEQIHKLRIYLRAWCDYFPSVVMNEFDTALNNISRECLFEDSK